MAYGCPGDYRTTADLHCLFMTLRPSNMEDICYFTQFSPRRDPAAAPCSFVECLIPTKALLNCNPYSFKYSNEEMNLTATPPSPVTDNATSDWGTDIPQAESTPDTLSEAFSICTVSSDIDLGEHVKYYQIAPNIGKRNHSGWAWEHRIRLEMLSDKSIWWLCRCC